MPAKRGSFAAMLAADKESLELRPEPWISESRRRQLRLLTVAMLIAEEFGEDGEEEEGCYNVDGTDMTRETLSPPKRRGHTGKVSTDHRLTNGSAIGAIDERGESSLSLVAHTAAAADDVNQHVQSPQHSPDTLATHPSHKMSSVLNHSPGGQYQNPAFSPTTPSPSSLTITPAVLTSSALAKVDHADRPALDSNGSEVALTKHTTTPSTVPGSTELVSATAINNQAEHIQKNTAPSSSTLSGATISKHSQDNTAKAPALTANQARMPVKRIAVSPTGILVSLEATTASTVAAAPSVANSSMFSNDVANPNPVRAREADSVLIKGTASKTADPVLHAHMSARVVDHTSHVWEPQSAFTCVTTTPTCTSTLTNTDTTSNLLLQSNTTASNAEITTHNAGSTKFANIPTTSGIERNVPILGVRAAARKSTPIEQSTIGCGIVGTTVHGSDGISAAGVSTAHTTNTPMTFAVPINIAATTVKTARVAPTIRTSGVVVPTAYKQLATDNTKSSVTTRPTFPQSTAQSSTSTTAGKHPPRSRNRTLISTVAVKGHLRNHPPHSADSATSIPFAAHCTVNPPGTVVVTPTATTNNPGSCMRLPSAGRTSIISDSSKNTPHIVEAATTVPNRPHVISHVHNCTAPSTTSRAKVRGCSSPKHVYSITSTSPSPPTGSASTTSNSVYPCSGPSSSSAAICAAAGEDSDATSAGSSGDIVWLPKDDNTEVGPSDVAPTIDRSNEPLRVKHRDNHSDGRICPAATQVMPSALKVTLV